MQRNKHSLLAWLAASALASSLDPTTTGVAIQRLHGKSTALRRIGEARKAAKLTEIDKVCLSAAEAKRERRKAHNLGGK
jgi:hypothetical protein